MFDRTRARRGRRAFTLLEVLMVVAIIGLLAAVLVPQLYGTQRRARIDVTKLLIEKINQNVERYNLHMGHYPREEDGGLKALIEKPSDSQEALKWGGPYLEAKDLKDVWGNDIQYTYPGRVNEERFDLLSAGPDGSEGTEDDITNYEKAP